MSQQQVRAFQMQKEDKQFNPNNNLIIHQNQDFNALKAVQFR
jgi:hypothetical protein